MPDQFIHSEEHLLAGRNFRILQQTKKIQFVFGYDPSHWKAEILSDLLQDEAARARIHLQVSQRKPASYQESRKVFHLEQKTAEAG